MGRETAGFLTGALSIGDLGIFRPFGSTVFSEKGEWPKLQAESWFNQAVTYPDASASALCKQL